MPQMVVTVNADERESVWHLDASNGQNAAQIWPTRNLTIEWADGTIAVLPRRFPCLTNPGFATTVDVTTLDYYVVTYRGSTAPANIVPVSALSTLDTLFADKDWGLLRVFGRWGSRDPLAGGGAGNGLPSPLIDGALLYVDPSTHKAVWLPGTTGDLIRCVAPNIWQPYGIDQGNQGDFLKNDRAGTGLAVWGPGNTTAPLAVGSNPPGTVIARSDGTNTKVLGLWNGSSNTAAPTGWTDPGYNDSGWASPAVYTRGGGWPLVTGCPFLSTTTGVAPNEKAAFLVRQHLSIAAPLPGSFALTVSEDNIATALINGREIYYYNRPPSDLSPAHQVRFDATVLRTVDENVLCFLVQNDDAIPDPATIYGVSYALSAL